MKTPLIYQLTEESCGEVAIFNCMSFLFEREEMPTSFLKIMASFSVGCYDEQGFPTHAEFCDNLLFFASSWLKDFSKSQYVPLNATYLLREDVDLSRIRNCIQDGGCVCMKSHEAGCNYVAITGIDDDYVYIFDSYFRETTSSREDRDYDVVNNPDLSYNRRVKIDDFISESKSGFCLGPENLREAILFRRINPVLQREMV